MKEEELFQEISDKYEADIILLSGGISLDTSDKIIHNIRRVPEKRGNIVLILTTTGGSPDSAYRIVRYLKRIYDKLIIFVFGICKSAGTLMTLGANKIVMSDFSELGPLDIQLSKEEELIQSSGLDYIKSLTTLGTRGADIIEHVFLMLKEKSGGLITTKTATEVGTSLATGLISPITSQIDPVKLGEVHRAMLIAIDYGTRLCDNEELIHKLTVGYSSHSFVLDIEEAKHLFGNVVYADELERNVEESLFNLVRYPQNDLVILLHPNLNIEDSHEKEGILKNGQPNSNGKEQKAGSSPEQEDEKGNGKRSTKKSNKKGKGSG